ncbi:MAG: DUF2384 domain-containing protein [Nitrococcus sp.]|nr:DUF2384 domain-containing protein [Nitrococcus sp.]
MRPEIEILGGQQVFGPAMSSNLHELIQAGLPHQALVTLSRKLHLTHDDEARVLAVSSSTLRRRRQGGRLGPAVSDRLARIARLYSLAEDVLESEEAASAWLREPVPMLDGEIPLELLATDWGAERVREVLMCIEHGLFA